MSFNLSEIARCDFESGAAAGAMNIMHSGFGVWPFSRVDPHEPDDERWVEGHVYDLYASSPIGAPFFGANPIQVIDMSATSMTFVSLEGHFEGPGNVITFSTRKDETGDIWLDVEAKGPTTWRDWGPADWFTQWILPQTAWTRLASFVAFDLISNNWCR
jgi:hypothetical protein